MFSSDRNNNCIYLLVFKIIHECTKYTPCPVEHSGEKLQQKEKTETQDRDLHGKGEINGLNTKGGRKKEGKPC